MSNASSGEDNTASDEFAFKDTYRHAMTVSQFLQAVSGVTVDAPLIVAVRDKQHFNRLLGDYAVRHVSVDRGPDTDVVVLDVEQVS